MILYMIGGKVGRLLAFLVAEEKRGVLWSLADARAERDVFARDRDYPARCWTTAPVFDENISSNIILVSQDCCTGINLSRFVPIPGVNPPFLCLPHPEQNTPHLFWRHPTIRRYRA